MRGSSLRACVRRAGDVRVLQIEQAAVDELTSCQLVQARTGTMMDRLLHGVITHADHVNAPGMQRDWPDFNQCARCPEPGQVATPPAFF